MYYAMRRAGCFVLALLACSFTAPVLAQDGGRTAGLVDAPGRNETAATCTVCHYAAQFTGERLSRADWASVVLTMTGEYGMLKPDFALRDTVLTYLSTHFGPTDGDRADFERLIRANCRYRISC